MTGWNARLAMGIRRVYWLQMDIHLCFLTVFFFFLIYNLEDANALLYNKSTFLLMVIEDDSVDMRDAKRIEPEEADMRFDLSPHKEMRIYELLGVKAFQKLVFMLEKLIHFKDKERNLNYHFRGLDAEALDAFVKYLFYNGSIHARNLLYFAGYVAIFFVFRRSVKWFDIAALLLALKDAYCVMLQRYNYLRIAELKKLAEQRREYRIQRRVKRLRERFDQVYDAEHIDEDLAFVRRMKQQIVNGENVVIGEMERGILERLSCVLNAENSGSTRRIER